MSIFARTIFCLRPPTKLNDDAAVIGIDQPTCRRPPAFTPRQPQIRWSSLGGLGKHHTLELKRPFGTQYLYRRSLPCGRAWGRDFFSYLQDPPHPFSQDSNPSPRFVWEMGGTRGWTMSVFRLENGRSLWLRRNGQSVVATGCYTAGGVGNVQPMPSVEGSISTI